LTGRNKDLKLFEQNRVYNNQKFNSDFILKLMDLIPPMDSTLPKLSRDIQFVIFGQVV
jgi:hypothetical protein